ncbi:hypothetical protein [Cognatitamlana onchidii]|uniref:hypothetical protein n=1 Tax=Cognatitamlana onchidii TaxID=2562860 RepID=UPI0010A67F1F|nr:hypothetical protein [Algibacter onchidii]
MIEKFVDIKEVSLNNNCPECFSKEGLRLKFSQKIVETRFYKSITSSIKYDLFCKNCNTTIYPVQWTQDIEQVVEYQQKAFKPKQNSTFIKKLTWVLVGVKIAFISLLLLAFF